MTRIRDYSGELRDPWFKTKGGGPSLARAVVSQFQWLDKRQMHHRQRNLVHLRMYSNRMAATMSGAAFADYDPWDVDRLRYNLVMAVIDAAVAQAAANRTRPFPLTIGGDYKAQRQAKRMQSYFDGQFYRTQQYQRAVNVFRDGAIWGTGLNKVVPRRGRVCYERILSDNWIVDDIESQNGPEHARSFFEYREVDKYAAMGAWSKHEKALKLSSVLRTDHWGRHRLSQPVGLVEAWYCASEDGADDGRHVIVCEKETLVDEVYKRTKPPVAAMRWKDAPVGYYGMGLAEEETPLQVEINYTLMRIQRILWHASSQTWVKKGNVNQASLNNDDATVREYDETPPVHLPINTGVGELYQHVQECVNRGFELAGISQMQAMAQKPPGINSGEAQRVYNDTASARFQDVMKRFEQYHLDVAELSLNAEADLEEEHEGRVLIGKSRRGLEELRFKDINLDRDRYVLQVFPTSLLPTQPQGKIQTIKEMAQIRPDLADMLMAQTELPDLDAALAKINSPYELADMLIERMLDYGEYRAPEPLWPLEVLLRQVNMALLKSDIDGVDEERRELLIQFIEQCQELLTPPASVTTPPPPGAPAMPPGPGAPPMMPPGPPGPPLLPPGMPPA